MKNLGVKACAWALSAPVALVACVNGDPATTTSEAEEIIGGFPATSSNLDVVGAFGIPFSAIFEDERGGEIPQEVVDLRPYLEDTPAARGDEEYITFCTGTLIEPDIVLSAEHCFSNFQGDEEFLIGFDGTHPDRSYAIEGVLAEDTIVGGAVGFGSDLALVYLEDEVEGIEPAALGSLSDDDVGTDYVSIGYGFQNNDQDSGTRMLGAQTLRGLGGNVADNLFGDFDGFLEHVHELGLPDDVDPAEVYESLELIEDYEATFGHAPGNAQACNGDSGGPVLRNEDGDFVVYGVASWVMRTEELICNWGTNYATFGPAAEEFLERGVACPMMPSGGTCDGDVAKRCAPPEEGGWRPVETDCSAIGLTCGEDAAGDVTCVEDSCADIPEDGMCDGDTVIRCTEENEGDRRPVHTDCSVLGLTCGEDDGGELTCVE